ncbi:zinc-binding dehydrogenase [Amycolatopsis jiangsuensis]|uniref:NADPH:quinone reductase-like Zn-dependent oxidoreductase n=1 Tax=Amycolatopsis jiangsuensis TaxID=1181879 RepID=A0A840J498_9PSEU|nr:zinc-binding dehydrogenase [Amycolatopsis jiangsuensis]MBB4688880.1 NADPH:quinone reductase-like Zn-dependent oxidoreductase [Amycolatopsis jiangsuensis]
MLRRPDTWTDGRLGWYSCWTLGSECDGGFAEYVVAPGSEAYGVRCDWSDAELASVPCAFSTAENLLDLRTIYLKDLSLFGCTFQDDVVFANVIDHVEKGHIRPVVAKTYPLAAIRQAQEDFLRKVHTGKLVLVP